MDRETDLYAPVKRFLEDLGYEVKAEVKGCDVVARKDDGPLVIVELKRTLSLDLVLQGVARLSLSDTVYLAIGRPDTPNKRRTWRARRRPVLSLCRRLGLGLMLVDPDRASSRAVDVLLDPQPYQPRKNPRRRNRLQVEFLARQGDPNVGGSTRVPIITAYRQDAMRCAASLAGGARPLKEVREASGVTRAGSILQKNHYGWFERVSRGVYALSQLGRQAVSEPTSDTPIDDGRSAEPDPS